ncbi:uncharacterized protein LOC124814941 [Hydra vulgaris]|uniref:uncharacterized protein LOC124814941 n=1 Tax=Hydra vulgaris TaxID=6087 RepID=UPI001F5F6475|nr:uncharacterized protein LOC124814941 [Hydra vulgaris]
MHCILHLVNTTNRFLIANTLNKVFQFVFTIKPHNQNLLLFAKRSSTSLLNFSFDSESVQKHLEALDKYKSAGEDQISPYVLKACVTTIAAPFDIIFQLSMEQVIVPKAWFVAKVTPLFKNSSKTDPTNYRPISITSVPCKIMERLIKDKVMHHLLSNNLLSQCQHGFISKKSCTTNLLETMDFWTYTASQMRPVDALFLDFAI